jgi:AcrR family transcriptional regulator
MLLPLSGCATISSMTTQTEKSIPRTARERARAEITREILDAALRQLATDGAPALSLRAIARDLGMASSAVYRYVASRDELLTRLIIDAYNSLGEAAETAEARADRSDLLGRWSAICIAVRSWAIANPNRYALIYGSPVPGYVAPPDTVAPASRVAVLLTRILLEATASGRLPAEITSDSVSPAASKALAPLRKFIGPDASDALIQRGVMVWTGLYGAVSFELFGQLHDVIGDGPGEREAWIAECIRRWAMQVGIA